MADTAAPGATSAWCGRYAVWGLARSVDPPPAVEGAEINLLGAAMLAAGLSSDPAVIRGRSLLVVPQRRRPGWAEAAVAG